jgi:hypothetical protein
MGKSNTHSIQGSWRGHYHYSEEGSAHGFEAVFIEQEGHLEGSILDDGRLGEASVTGSFAYPNLSFTKAYYSTARSIVEYEGLMSEDGNTLAGTWHIGGSLKVHGTWTAKRYDDAEELKFEYTDTEQKKKEQELTQTLNS